MSTLKLLLEIPQQKFTSADSSLRTWATSIRFVDLVLSPHTDVPRVWAALDVDKEAFPVARTAVEALGGRLFHNPALVLPSTLSTDCNRVVGAAKDLIKLLKAPVDGSGSVIFVADGGFSCDFICDARPDVTLLTEFDLVESPASDPDHANMVAWCATINAARASLVNVNMPADVTLNADAAIRAFRKLRELEAGGALDKFDGLVVCCAWETGDIGDDAELPADVRLDGNDAHPLRQAVDLLVARGFDVVAAAGNGGCEKPPRRLQGMSRYSSCLTVSAAFVDMSLVPVSSRGAQGWRKPDVSAFANFVGSQVFGESAGDPGTSAATGVAAGVVAAFRTRPGCDRRTIAPAAPLLAVLKETLLVDVIDEGELTRLDDHHPGFGWGILR